jgi:hypothetical protein
MSLSNRKRVSVFLPRTVYKLIEQAAKRQGISVAEYGFLAMSWYFGITEAKAAAKLKGRAGYKPQRSRHR